MTEARSNSLSDGTHAPRDPFERLGTGTLGMTVFLASLSALFAATMAGFIIMLFVLRNRSEGFEPDTRGVAPLEPMPDLPPLPSILWISTIVILLSSVTIQWAKSSIRRGGQAGLRAGMIVTMLLAIAFLALQVMAWFDWNDAVQTLEHNAYRFGVTSFYLLSMVHALHVIGGILPMLVVAGRALSGRYSAGQHAGVGHLTLYWHFLDVVWVIMFALMLIVL